MGLSEWYQSVKSLILLMKLLPTINKVLSIILQEERQQNYGSNKSPNAKVEETNALANSVESGGVNCNFKKGRDYNGYQVGRGRVNSSKEKVCTYYGYNGHMVDMCYRKHVYPPG